MAALWAATPLAVILLAMVTLGRSAFVAGLAGACIAALLVLAGPFPAPDSAGLFLGAGAEALHSTLTILWILLPALALYEFQKATGAIGRIRDWLAALTEDRRQHAILIAWFFGLFMEGAAGFGTPVALAAPLLVGLGYAPLRAVVLALLGHAAGVSFGAVGTPALAQLLVVQAAPSALALQTAILHACAGPVLLAIMVRLAGSRPMRWRDLAWVLFAAACFLVPSLALAAVIGPELPTLGGALIGIVVYTLGLRAVRGGRFAPLSGLGANLAPYAAILALVLATRLIGPVQDALRALTLAWEFGAGYSGSFQPLYHPGTILALGLLGAACATGRAAYLPAAVGAALGRLGAVALALIVMLLVSRLMVHAGMIGALAAAAAQAGPVWPLIAPGVGILGTFITGSATASNILFTDLQLATAQSLQLPVLWLIAAQGFGAAIGNVVAPHNIIAGSATVGLTGREGAVLAQTILPCLLYALLGGAVVYAMTAP